MQIRLASDTQDVISEITRINQTTIAEISNYTVSYRAKALLTIAGVL